MAQQMVGLRRGSEALLTCQMDALQRLDLNQDSPTYNKLRALHATYPPCHHSRQAHILALLVAFTYLVVGVGGERL